MNSKIIENIENKSNKNKGISLVVLVITIIIMLILSGSIIITIISNNPIEEAYRARQAYNIDSAQTELSLLYYDKVVETLNGRVDIEDYTNYLEEKGYNTKVENGKYYVEAYNMIFELVEEDSYIEIVHVKDGVITAPNIQKIDVTSKTKTEIGIKVTALRMEEGTYYYYIGEDEENLNTVSGSNTSGEFIFTGLTEGVTYYIKVVGESTTGEKDEKIITDKIEKIPDATSLNMSYTISWLDGKATVSVTTNTKYKIQTSLDNVNYTQISKIEGLSDGDIVYARLTDGISYGSEMLVLVSDVVKPILNLETGEVTTKSIEVKTTASDSESGIKEYRYYISDTVDNYGETADITNEVGSAIFENLEQNTTYYIKVEVEDAARNIESKTTVIKTELIPGAETNIARKITWQADGSVNIVLSTTTNYDVVYSYDRVNYTDYTSSIEAVNGTNIHICLTDGRNYGEDYKIAIEDYTGPTVNVKKEEATSNSIKVTVTASDLVAGMSSSPKYTYYIKANGEEAYTKIAEDVESSTYTFTGLNSQTTYDIKVTTKDILENVGEGKVDVTTEEFKYVSGNVTFASPTWEAMLATVRVTNNTEYNMQYQVVAKGEEINLDGTWNTVQEKVIDVGNLKDEYTIIVRLYDGINVTAGYATCLVEDTVVPEVTVEGNAVEWTTSNVILTINATDNESGLTENCYSFDGGSTWQASNTKEYEKNTSGIVIKVKDEAGNVATSETINITKIDKTGPKINVETEAGINTIKLSISEVNDTGVGTEDVPTYTYYITSENGKIDEVAGESSTEKEKIYTGLTQSTTYYIKVEIEDKLGNKTQVYKTVLTGSLDVTAGDLTISEVTWESKKASVTLINNSSYKMEYQLVTSGETFDESAEWTKTEEKEITLTDLLNGDKVYARLTDDINTSAVTEKEIKDEAAPVVTVTGNATEWQNTNVLLTINATDNESGLTENCYSFDGGTTWQAGNTKEYEENTSGIVIKVKDEAGNIATNKTINITKIDKTGPEITLQKEITTKQATIDVTSSDSGVGMPDSVTYTYYKKADGETDYIKVAETESASYTYENLTANTKYTLKIETKDKLGNVGEKALEITTYNLLYSVGDITFTNIVWSNGIATVTMNNNVSEYDMEYQISEDGSDISEDGTWIKVSEKQIDIGSLKDEYIIYARITDGYNSTIGYATCNIDNISKATYTEEELANETNREEYDILGISVTGNEIRVQIDRQIDNASMYNYYYKTINDEEYKLISTSTNYDDPAVITDIKEGAIYKIKALVIDSDGNITRSKNTATTIALEEASNGTTYADNRTYIDESKTINVRTSAGTGSAGNGETEEVKAGYTVSLPATFKISSVGGETKQEEGVVLIDGNSNEYVWIPVNDAVYDSVTEYATGTGNAQTKTYKPMAQKQSIEGYYESIVYAYNGELSYRNSVNTGIGKSSYKEPSLLTNNGSDGYTWNIGEGTTGQSYDVDSTNYNSVLNFATSIEFGRYMANSYTNMVTAVESYGGFYVGRYETTIETQDANIIVGSKPNQSILATNNWYKMNLYQDSNRYDTNPYSNVGSVTSSMIWGSQWDSMLNYILTGEDASKITTKTGSQKKAQSNSGQDSTDVINNIYDLGANAYEWTQEANSYNYRIYRGGSYDVSTSGTVASRGNIIPTDQGPVFGTRLGLYMQSVNDVTGPSIKINNVESTSNTISVEVTAIDKETGVKEYIYYISEDGETFNKVEETESNNYTYTGLTQNKEYTIKVVAKDGVGNEGEGKVATQSTVNLGDVASSAITRVQRYGPNGSGIIKLELDEKYTNSGYYIEYQVLESTETLDFNGTWIKGTELQGLTNGEIIYATVYDGVNRSSDTYTEIVAELEEYDYYIVDGKTSENETVKYTDEEGNIAYIPSGFKVGVTDSVKNINDGLVIEDESGNQYVWVPVENVIYDGVTTLPTSSASTSTYKPMVRYQKGYSSETEKQYFEGIAYNFASTYATGSYVKTKSNTLGTTGNREPSLITASSDYTWNVAYKNANGTSYDTQENYYKYFAFGTGSGVSAFETYTEFGQYMNEEYSNMIKSVEKYGGFYVGRYETSLSGTVGNVNAVPESKITKTPIYNQNWYKSYYYQDSNLNSKNPNYDKTSVTSSMIWGSQWDAVMNWILSDENTKEFANKIVGNRTNTVQNTGAYSEDFVKNIFDMSANVAEWTQESRSTSYREYRGGYCVSIDDVYTNPASGRYTVWSVPVVITVNTQIEGQASLSKNYLGSRMSMYIKSTDDTTSPNVEIESTETETNNIKVSVNATDSQSGIKKYKYYISYVDFESSEFTESDIIKSVESYGSSYVFTELYQNQSYYIKAEAINNAGLSNVAYTGIVKTNVLEIQEGAIVKEKVYGKDGEGIAYFKISSETNFEKEGYYIEYQIDSDGTGYNANGTWTKGDTVKGLSVGDVIYLRLYDGINDSGYYMIVNVTELESFSEVYESTTIYEDYDTVVYEDGTSEEVIVGTAYIPAGFKVATSSITNKIKNGLVIEDESGNQYVWIPVENAIYDGVTTLPTSSSSTATYKPMVRYQSGSSASSENKYYEGILYKFTTGKSWLMSNSNRLGTMSYREPSLVTNSTANGSWIYTAGNDYDATNYTLLSDIGINSAKSMGEYLNDKFTEMVESVNKYGGFYVGRYETSLSGTTVQSKYDQKPMTSINWYKMYLYEDSEYASNPYNSSSSVSSQMIWGSQWDAMLTYIQQGTDVNKVTTITGNHTGYRATTGQFGNDVMNNIFDLSSNVLEWTQEAYLSIYRVPRGSYYSVYHTGTADYRGNNAPTYSYTEVGSRYTLYLK